MKRTRQRFDRPQMDVPAFTSGLSQFEGEDLLWADRVAYQAAQQRRWLDEQINDKKMRKQQERQEDNDYATQTDAITRMRSMLEDDTTNRTSNYATVDLRQANAKLAQEKRDREQTWRQDQRRMDQFELNATINQQVPSEQKRMRNYLATIGESVMWSP